MGKNTVLVKENGKIITSVDNVNKEIFVQEHLCSTCGYANPIACQKIADIFINKLEDEEPMYRPKQPIGEYPEITDGYQILDENNIVRKFVVTGCKNYKLIDKNISSKLGKEELDVSSRLLKIYDVAYQHEVESKIKKRTLNNEIRKKR